MQQLRKYATVLELLLGSGLRATMEILLEAVFSMGPLGGYITRPTELSLVSPYGGGFEYLHRRLASGRRRRKGKPVPVDITAPPCSWRL
jgi:hypothetical protein